jgi:predicted nucleotide-binding protein (sugar kinase/HSP70/actin superfamily)
MAGQVADLVDAGIKTLFHPSILTERPTEKSGKEITHCPYIQASSQFFVGSFQVEWKEPFISYEIDPDSFHKEHFRLARAMGFSKPRARRAIQVGMERLEAFQAAIREEGERFLGSLAANEQALIVLGKPYHTADSFLNMNLGSLCQRLGVPALPGDLYPLALHGEKPAVAWKYQGQMIRLAREIGADHRLFPVLITFFGCGPDPFTLRHVREALGGKPLLVLEMDEFSSRAGIITRLEAFLERIRSGQRKQSARGLQASTTQGSAAARSGHLTPKLKARAEVLFLPDIDDHAYGFAAAARSVGVEARVLPPTDQESECLGRPHMVGGECHPFALILGDYLKLASWVHRELAERSLFYLLGPEACRLGQYSVYIDKVRREIGCSIGVISQIDEGLEAFGLSQSCRRQVLLRGWEGLNAYDLLRHLFFLIRPVAEDTAKLDIAYAQSRDEIFSALSEGRVREGMERALETLSKVPLDGDTRRPIIAVTGDYYTRVVSFANNDVYQEIERLGGTILTPPTFSDAFKISPLQSFAWKLKSGCARAALSDGLLYALMAFSEFKVKGGKNARRVLNKSLDILGRRIWKSAAVYADTRLPGGIIAPIATAVEHLGMGASGILNLITLNCSYGTVVTAALLRALKDYPGVPMLTLVYDGLKKTNERTRLEAFMEQVWDRHRENRAD